MAVSAHNPVIGDLLRALGLEGRRGITALDIRIRVDEVVTVTVTEHASKEAMGELAQVVSAYTLVPRES